MKLKPNLRQQRFFHWWEILTRLLMFKLVDSRSSRFWNRTTFPSCTMFKMSNSGLFFLVGVSSHGKNKDPGSFSFFGKLLFVFSFPSILDFVNRKIPPLSHYVWEWRIFPDAIPNFLLNQNFLLNLNPNWEREDEVSLRAPGGPG